MSNRTIPTLTLAISLNGTEQIYAVQSGSDVRVTLAQIVSLATGGGGASPLPIAAGGTGATTVAGAQTNLEITQLIASYLTGLPTSLPASSGQLWNNGGVISVS